MRKKFRVIIYVLLAVILASVLGFRLFKEYYVPSHLRENPVDNNKEIVISEKFIELNNIIKKAPTWEEFKNNSDRVNVLVFGTDGFRADTLIVLSYSKENEDIFLLNVPRDTKHYVEGMNYLGQDKINAVFCFPDGKGGALNQMKAVSELINLDIHYYIKVNYHSVVNLVDSLGGVSVDIPFDMNYDDPYCKPELHIHFKAGNQILNGKQSLEYLRWRKNNNGTGDNDLKRIQRQQDFIINLLKTAVKKDLVNLIKTSYEYVKTNLTIEDIIYYSSDLIDFDFDKIRKDTVIGETDYSYFYLDENKTTDLIKKLYGYNF